MKPHVSRVMPYETWSQTWAVNHGGHERHVRYFGTWREAYDWAFDHQRRRDMMKDKLFYATNRHGTCVETRIMRDRVVRPYWFCGGDCPEVETEKADGAKRLLTFMRELQAEGYHFDCGDAIEVWHDSRLNAISSLDVHDFGDDSIELGGHA